MPTDPELQQRFEQCVDDCAGSLFRVAFRLTGNRTLASELVQETYLNAWKNISGLKDPERMRSWLFAILRNQYSKLIRKESRTAPASGQLDSIAVMSKTNDQTTDLVQEAIARLDENHKLPVLLVSMEGLSVDEASKLLDLPRGTVLSRLHRGRQKLKEILVRGQSRVAGNEGYDGI
jgi:RNA polymerase sigma-70 factor (ECF subfamily)